jgi:hypothetical protein
MTLKIQIIAIIVSLLLLSIIFELIRRRKLKPEYSIFWVFIGIVMLLLSVFKNLLNKLADILGVFPPVFALLLIGFAGIVLILLYISVLVSEFSSENKEIFKELSILRWKIEQIRKDSENGRLKK